MHELNEKAKLYDRLYDNQINSLSCRLIIMCVLYPRNFPFFDVF